MLITAGILEVEFGTPGRKEEGRYTGDGKKGGKNKVRKVAGTEIKGCGWREVCCPPPPLPVRPLAPPPFSQKWQKCRIQVLRSQERASLP